MISPVRNVVSVLRAVFHLSWAVALAADAAQGQEAARFVVEEEVAGPPSTGITATIGALGVGSRLMKGGEFEPAIQRDWLYAAADAPEDAPGLIPVAQWAISRFDTIRDGALDGAEVSVLRVVDGELRTVREARIVEGGYNVSGWLPEGGNNKLVPADRTETQVKIAPYERPGRQRWYAVRSVDTQGRLSPVSAPAEVSLPDELSKTRGDGPKLVRFNFDSSAPESLRGPEAPTHLSAHYDASGWVILDWDAPANDDDLAGYMVYKSYVPPAEMEGFFIETEGEGEPVVMGDLVTIRAELVDLQKEAFVSDRVWTAKAGRAIRPEPISSGVSENPSSDWKLVRHPEDDARNWGGRSYLQVNLKNRSNVGLGTHNHSGTYQTYYPVLRPGVPYKVTVRLRGERAGRAIVKFEGPYHRSTTPTILPYGTEWQEVTAEITVPHLLKERGPVGRIVLELQGPGRIDVDEFRIYPAATSWLDYSDEEYERLAASGVSALRTHGWIKTGTNTYDLRALLSEGVIPGSSAPSMPVTLAMMDRAGTDPWLQIEPHFSEAEWLGLVEYLAAPFDPATDNPEDKPWAALRVSQGRDTPWTEAFGRIFFEIGNETWNRMFRPWIFSDMTDAATGEKLNAAQIYGLFQSRVAEILRSSPYWDEDLQNKVDFVIGGRNRFNYGAVAARFAPAASDILTVAAYNGGWDEGEGPPQQNPASYANVLNQVSQGNLPRARENMDYAREIMRDQDRELAVGTYEAGPGYALNGLNNAKVTETQAAEQERVMKSRAAGVATLDTFLAQRLAGYTTQNFFTFSEGSLWSSHAPWHMGGDPYPSWTLLSLMNHLGAGEMLSVEAHEVPVRDLKGFKNRIDVDDAPQIAVYATRDAERLTLFAISRRVPGYPDGAGDNCTPVTIELPEALPAGPVALHRTGGAYDDHGAAGAPPPIDTIEVPREEISDGMLVIGAETGAEECGLPAASAYIYVIGEDGTAS